MKTYFVLGPVFHGCIQILVAILQSIVNQQWAKDTAVSLVSDKMLLSQHLFPKSKL